MKTIGFAIDLNFSARLLEMMFCIHTSPRVIKVGKFYSSLITPYNSLVAGCGSAIWLSRIVVCSILQEVHKIGPRCVSRNFYDDITSRVSGTENEIADVLVDHATRLARQISATRLTFNPDKTVVIASKLSIARNIVLRLAKRNIFIKVATQVRDLGIDAGAGVRRATRVMKGRIGKAVTRLRKTRGLVKACRFARKLITTGSQPSWQYGVEAYGISDACVSRLRAATAYATGLGGSKGCPVTAIRISIGEAADPLFAATMPSVKWWTQLWSDREDEEVILRRTWEVARVGLEGDRFSWARVKGPIATVVANLYRLGWKPQSPDKWLDNEGLEWEITRTE